MEVAEANGIIMLFPQNNPLVSRGGSSQGCWDTYGAGGEFYATQKGHQLQTLRRMIDAVMGVPYDNHGIDGLSGYDNNRPYRLDNANRRPYRVRPAPRRNLVRANGVVTSPMKDISSNGFTPMGDGNGFGMTASLANNIVGGTGVTGASGPSFNGGPSGNGFGEEVTTVMGPISEGFAPQSPPAGFTLADPRGNNRGIENNDVIVGNPGRTRGRNNQGRNRGAVAYSSVAEGNIIGNTAGDFGFGNIEDDVPLLFRDDGRSTSVNTYANVGK